MFTHVHHDLEGLAAERFRSLAAQLQRLQRQGAPSDCLDAVCRDEIRWAATAPGLNGCREKYEACARLLTDLAKLRWRVVPDGFGIELAAPNARRVPATETAAYKESVRQELVSQLRQQFAQKSVRDAAHPSHAVMGITGLSNAPLALGDRDRALGWTATATQERARQLTALPEPEAATVLAALLDDLETNLQLGLDSISHDQLLKPGEAENPTEEVIERLNRRAAELARLLQARRVLRQRRERLLSPAHAASTYAVETVATAVNAAWVCAKNARAGTSMLEMTVCGAVRPYNHLLGGKLAALLMLSPEVADDYTLRYGGAVSIISSMMKNEPVVKDSRLVFLGTTSLYLHGASQYNRVRLPAGVISPEQAEIRYEPMGETGGFGTVQFSADTVEAVEKVVTSSKGYRQVNSVFGEGRSPKLRKLRTGQASTLWKMAA